MYPPKGVEPLCPHQGKLVGLRSEIYQDDLIDGEVKDLTRRKAEKENSYS
jgi:hypothetical protein